MRNEFISKGFKVIAMLLTTTVLYAPIALAQQSDSIVTPKKDAQMAADQHMTSGAANSLNNTSKTNNLPSTGDLEAIMGDTVTQPAPAKREHGTGYDLNKPFQPMQPSSQFQSIKKVKKPNNQPTVGNPSTSTKCTGSNCKNSVAQ